VRVRWRPEDGAVDIGRLPVDDSISVHLVRAGQGYGPTLLEGWHWQRGEGGSLRIMEASGARDGDDIVVHYAYCTD
jgi:hypothetical protein